MIKFLPLDFLGVSYRIPWKDKNAVYRLQISASVLEIFKFEKWVKYANERTDDVIHPTQYYINYINRAILANFEGRLIVLQQTPTALKNSVPMETHSSPGPTLLISIF